VVINTTVVPCTLVLALTSSGYADSNALFNAALAAAAAPASCAPFTQAALDAFHHIIVYHPTLSVAPFDYLGLGSMFGKSVWMNGPNAARFVIEHEVGHNYGLKHASVWPAGGAFIEYGDKTDVMGSARSDQPPYLNGMAQGDFSAVAKFAVGWLPDSRLVALHPHGLGAASGLASNASFLLAALDRDNPVGVNPFGAYPATAALAARLTVGGPRPAIAAAGGSLPGRNSYAFLFYRAMAYVPGLYLVEAELDSSGSSNPFLVCNEPKCTEQLPIVGAFDAFVYDRNGTRALIEVGNLTAAFPQSPQNNNTKLQNSAYQVTVSYLGANGRKLGAALPAGCSATTGLCAADVVTEVSATGAFTRGLSASAQSRLPLFKRKRRNEQTLLRYSRFASGAVPCTRKGRS
jgi:hypothetical protein